MIALCASGTQTGAIESAFVLISNALFCLRWQNEVAEWTTTGIISHLSEVLAEQLKGGLESALGFF